MKSSTSNSAAEHARLRKLLTDMARAAELAGPHHQAVQSLRTALQAPPAGASYDPGWPWQASGLGFEWWTRTGQRVGASRQQLEFTAAWVACGNAAPSRRASLRCGRQRSAPSYEKPPPSSCAGGFHYRASCSLGVTTIIHFSKKIVRGWVRNY